MNTEFFLGANSGGGFYSLGSEFANEKGDMLYLIKAGPGGGKSGFMRSVGAEAEKRGLDVEYILCSGDPSSLDGVYIPKLGAGLFDATSPHALEPRIFGYDSYYVNLGQFCAESRDARIGEYTAMYKSSYTAAYSYLSAAESIKNAEIPNLIGEKELSAVRKRVLGTLKRKLKAFENSGGISRRFIRCISCEGELVLNDSILKLCKPIYRLDDCCGLGQCYLSEAAEYCASHRIRAVLCPSPLSPDRLDAVLIPGGPAFVSSPVWGDAPADRRVRLDALIASDAMSAHRTELRRRDKLYADAMSAAYCYLSAAKRDHDRLEELYHPLVDFEKLSAFRELFIEKLFRQYEYCL